jgi:hypothetical protein
MALELTNVPQLNSFQIFALPEKPSTASLRLEWTPGVDAYVYRSSRVGFVGSYRLAQARIDFSFTTPASATDDSVFTFRSNPEGQRVVFAQVGHEMNGLFAATDAAR